MERKVFHYHMVTELLGMYDGACSRARNFQRLISLYRSEDSQSRQLHPLVDASEYSGAVSITPRLKRLAKQLHSDCSDSDAFDLSNEARSLLLEQDQSGVEIAPVASVHELLVRELSFLPGPAAVLRTGLSKDEGGLSHPTMHRLPTS
jgi:hypothetical protein